MRCYQVRDYDRTEHGADYLRDAQGNAFKPVRYCATVAAAKAYCAGYGNNDGPTSRASDILVVEIEVGHDKDAILQVMNGGQPFGATHRVPGGKVYEIGPRGGLRESEELDV